MMALKCLALAILLLGTLGPIDAASHGHDHEEDDHEEACGENMIDAFDEIKEAVNVTADELNAEALEEIVHHIVERFECGRAECECFEPDEILTTGSLDAPVKEEDIGTFSIILLYKLQNLTNTCNGENTGDWSHWWSSHMLPDGHPHELEEFLDKLKDQLKEHDEHDDEHDDHHDDEHDDDEHGDGDENDGHEHGDGNEHDDDEHEDGDQHMHDDEHSSKCFDAKDVMHQAGITHDSTPTEEQRKKVASLIISYLLHGYEINGCPADRADFLDGIWESLGLHGDEALSETVFNSFLSKLGIGSSTGGDGHGHEEENGHAHDHKRKKREVKNEQMDRQKRATEEEQSPVAQCFSGEQLLTTYNIDHAAGVTQTDFVNLCPALIQQQISGACSVSTSKDEEDEPSDEKKIGIGFACILVISLGALFGVFIIPCLSDRTRLYMMCLFIGLAVGTLASDAMLHLIPEAFGLHAHDDDGHDHGSGPHVEPYFWKALVIVGGIYLFYLTETILSYFGGSHHHHHHAHEHHEMEPGTKYSNGHVKSVEDGTEVNAQGMCDIKPMAWMIIIGDAVHNLADGLAVGAAFSLSISSGLATSIAVFCHEVPHEVGDFAVLLRSGMTYCRAAFWNFFSALTAMVGFFIAVLVATDEDARRWIFTLAAGMFLYVALADMIPELISMKSEARHDGRHWLMCFFLQNLGILLGVAIMVVIALYEDDIHDVSV